MISLDKCKRIDPTLKKLSDQELESIRASLYGFAELAIEDFIEKNDVSNNPERSLPDS